MALRDLTSVDGPARREVPVSAMALQPPEQYFDAFPLTLTLLFGEQKIPVCAKKVYTAQDEITLVQQKQTAADL